MNILFYYSDIYQPGGLPDHFLKIAGSMHKLERSTGVVVFLSDTHSIKRYGNDTPERRTPKFDLVICTVEVRNFSRSMPQLTKLRMNGARIAVFTSGMLSNESARGNWFTSNRNLAVKGVQLKMLRAWWKRIATHFLTSGDWETNDSGLPVHKSWFAPVFSDNALADSIGGNAVPQQRSQSAVYFGRADYVRKGIDKIMTLASRYPHINFYLLVSRADDSFIQTICNAGLPNVVLNTTARGGELLPYLRDASLFITLTPHPVQLRAPSEAIGHGLALLVSKNIYLEELQIALASRGLSDAITISDENVDLSDLLERVSTINREDLANTARTIYNSDHFAAWLLDLCENKASRSYFKHAVNLVHAD